MADETRLLPCKEHNCQPIQENAIYSYRSITEEMVYRCRCASPFCRFFPEWHTDKNNANKAWNARNEKNNPFLEGIK